MSRFEDLPLELLIKTFEYLPTLNMFQAFSNLNEKFETALNLTRFSVDLRSISAEIWQEFYSKRILKRNFNQIRHLQISNQFTQQLCDLFFHDYQLQNLTNLQSMTVMFPSFSTLLTMMVQLSDMKRLQHLVIESNVIPDEFFSTICNNLSSVTSFHLIGSKISDEIDFQSNIEHLTVSIENIALLVNLLDHFPKLKSLNVSLQSSLKSNDGDDEFPAIDLVVCEHLQRLTIRIQDHSSIFLDEILFLFKNLRLNQLVRFCYESESNSTSHLDVTLWNEIFSTFHVPLVQFRCFIQTSIHSHSDDEIKEIFQTLQSDFIYPIEFSFSVSDSNFIVHPKIYPKKDFRLSNFSPSKISIRQNDDPLNCDQPDKFRRVHTLLMHGSSITELTILPKQIKNLHLLDSCCPTLLGQSLKLVADQLRYLRIVGLPTELPTMNNLQQLSIQQEMFQLDWISTLISRCPRLELLMFQIDSIDRFLPILQALKSLTELKFLHVFSYDSTRNWSNWIDDNQEQLNRYRYGKFCAKNLFLFVWF